jgi:hypothetical protein
MGAQGVAMKKRKAPIFTEARRRPSIPDPLGREMGYRRHAVKGFSITDRSVTTTEGDRR